MQRLEKLRRGLREAAEPLPEQLTPINKLVLKDKIKKKAIKRARRILNSHENDPLSIMLAASNPTVVFLRDTPIETADADKSIANARAKNGFKLLAQEAQKPDKKDEWLENMEYLEVYWEIEKMTTKGKTSCDSMWSFHGVSKKGYVGEDVKEML